MRFAICPINETSTASAFELATEVFVRHSHLHKAVAADLRSYRAYVVRGGFYRDVADGLSLMAVDRTDNTVMGVLIVRDFITPAPPQLADPRYAPDCGGHQSFGIDLSPSAPDICRRGGIGGYGRRRPDYAGTGGVPERCEWRWRHMGLRAAIAILLGNCHLR